MELRVENPELKPQIEAFAIKMLENCDLFVNTYGRGYARERLAVNFKTLYTDELNKRAKGQYSLGSSGVMTLFMKGSNGNKLTFEDIEKSGDLQTALHESVHAVFNKTPKECKELDIRCGSGIHELYNETEMGRGLNEGYTNWVCEKAGLHTMSYLTLTNLIKILELAIGPENVMRFGEGDIAHKLPELLGMQPNDCRLFLAKADTIYDYDDKSQDYGGIASILKRKKDFEAEKAKFPTIEMAEELVDELQGLNNNSLYTNIVNNADYISYAQENNLNPELEDSKLSYFEHMREFYSNKSKEMEQEVKGDIFSKYFKKELRETINTNNFSIDQYKKFSKLSSLIYINDKFENKDLQEFKENFGILRKNFFDRTEQDIGEAINSGTISVEQIAQYRDAINDDNYNDSNDFNAMLSKLMLPENPGIYASLFNTLSYQNMTSEIFNYRIFELKNQSGEKTDLFYSIKNDNHFSHYLQMPKVFEASSEIENKDTLFDMTLNDLQSMQEIVRNFLTLKEQICEKNPNTKLQIVDNVVISKADGEKPIFYLLDGNDFVLAEIQEFIPQNAQISKNHTNIRTETEEVKPLQIESMDVSGISEKNFSPEIEENYLEPISKNPFKRIFQEIKRRFFKSQPAIALANSQPKQDDKQMEDAAKKFNDRIHFVPEKQNTSTLTTNKSEKSKNKDHELTQ